MNKDISPTSYRIELRNRILKASMNEFLCKGVKSVKMDDIANSLGISKRTLYEIYSNKEELLLEAVKIHEEEYDSYMTKYASAPEHTVIDIIIEFYKKHIMNISNVSPSFFSELHKYKAVREYLENRRNERFKNAIEFFMRGVRDGYFRSDVNYGIILKIGNASLDFAMETQMYKIYDLATLLHNIIFLYLRGVCTTAGIKKLDEFIDSNI